MSRKYRIESGKSGSAMLLMEMICSVFFFMICASICILAFAKADHMSRIAKDTNQGILAAESTAEVFKQDGVSGLEEKLDFVKEDERIWSAVFRGDRDDEVVTVEIVDEGNGIQSADIHVKLEHRFAADPEELFSIKVKRYERS